MVGDGGRKVVGRVWGLFYFDSKGSSWFGEVRGRLVYIRGILEGFRYGLGC